MKSDSSGMHNPAKVLSKILVCTTHPTPHPLFYLLICYMKVEFSGVLAFSACVCTRLLGFLVFQMCDGMTVLFLFIYFLAT